MRELRGRVWVAQATVPVPSGDPPDGTGGTAFANAEADYLGDVPLVPVAESPTSAGGSPAPPTFQTRSNVARAAPCAQITTKATAAARTE
jgi:hypothetical protein